MSSTVIYKDLVWQDPERVSGQPCFYGTRVPVSHLFDYLADGMTVEEFADLYKLPLTMLKCVLRLTTQVV